MNCRFIFSFRCLFSAGICKINRICMKGFNIGMEPVLQDKTNRLKAILSEIGGCVIGFSGGVDSTLLFAVAAEVLGQRALAVTATSETYPERERREAEALAALIGGRHRVIVS